MIQESCRVLSSRTVAGGDIYVITFESQKIARTVEAGQFVNVRSWSGSDPLLRRPFSVYSVAPDGSVSILFNVVGKGTAHLSQLRTGDLIDVLGPLGNPFSLQNPALQTAVLVGGGLGVAPFPLFTQQAKRAGKKVITYLGARSRGQLVTEMLENLKTATDDGSAGFRGNVVELLGADLQSLAGDSMMLFGCGPTPMLRALAELAERRNVPCEISLEGPMGCGFGICQGCPVRLRGEADRYHLMCREGPVFNASLVEV